MRRAERGNTVKVHYTGMLEDGTVSVIAEVLEESVTIDANHPLAGKALTFHIELAEIV